MKYWKIREILKESDLVFLMENSKGENLILDNPSIGYSLGFKIVRSYNRQKRGIVVLKNGNPFKIIGKSNPSNMINEGYKSSYAKRKVDIQKDNKGNIINISISRPKIIDGLPSCIRPRKSKTVNDARYYRLSSQFPKEKKVDKKIVSSVKLYKF